ncbi:hypothetical protein C922_05459 [Plasmodium inui San Antonio 1]|uniref:Uncharacterized protein n=1 Tax=Plasmodium inui San Antonio 1 TaxID=1237626 RepID=W7AFT3_9APIC|nr:hypothetical protein C922_05459 [Plasmodium inui San Antonio 1]EUD64156.1 hypothetical protein C922_05459 [Plasmodium inui San Antonio 1]
MSEMKQVKLSDPGENYRNRIYADAGSRCSPGTDRYCYKELTGTTTAQKGFYGRWSSTQQKDNLSTLWQYASKSREAFETNNTLVQEDQDWKAILDCVVERAVSLPKVTLITPQGKTKIWEQAYWNYMTKNDVGTSWANVAPGQSLLSGIVCVMYGLLRPTGITQHPPDRVRQDCKRVYEDVMIELETDPQLPAEGTGVGLETFLRRIKEPGTEDRVANSSLGFLLAVVWGVTKCTKWTPGWTLGRYLAGNREGLQQLPPCFIHNGEVRCGAGEVKPGEATFTLYNQGETQLEPVTRKDKTKQVKVKAAEPPNLKSRKVANGVAGRPPARAPGQENPSGSWQSIDTPTIQISNKQPSADAPVIPPHKSINAEATAQRIQSVEHQSDRAIDSGARTLHPQDTTDDSSKKNQVAQRASTEPKGNQTTAEDKGTSPVERNPEVSAGLSEGLQNLKEEAGVRPPQGYPDSGTDKTQTSSSIGMELGVVASVISGAAAVYGMYKIYWPGLRRNRRPNSWLDDPIRVMYQSS